MPLLASVIRSTAPVQLHSRQLAVTSWAEVRFVHQRLFKFRIGAVTTAVTAAGCFKLPPGHYPGRGGETQFKNSFRCDEPTICTLCPRSTRTGDRQCTISSVIHISRWVITSWWVLTRFQLLVSVDCCCLSFHSVFFVRDWTISCRSPFLKDYIDLQSSNDQGELFFRYAHKICWFLQCDKWMTIRFSMMQPIDRRYMFHVSTWSQ